MGGSPGIAPGTACVWLASPQPEVVEDFQRAIDDRHQSGNEDIKDLQRAGDDTHHSGNLEQPVLTGHRHLLSERLELPCSAQQRPISPSARPLAV